jgi:hypothetical protein
MKPLIGVVELRVNSSRRLLENVRCGKLESICGQLELSSVVLSVL